MWKDEIVEDVHRIREEYGAKFGHDIDAIYEDIRRRQAESDREFVSFPRRRPLPLTSKPVIDHELDRGEGRAGRLRFRGGEGEDDGEVKASICARRRG